MQGSQLARVTIEFSSLESVLLDGKSLEKLSRTVDGAVGNEEPALAFLVLSAGTSESVDVRLTVPRGIDLNNVGNIWKIHSSGSNV